MFQELPLQRLAGPFDSFLSEVRGRVYMPRKKKQAKRKGDGEERTLEIHSEGAGCQQIAKENDGIVAGYGALRCSFRNKTELTKR